MLEGRLDQAWAKWTRPWTIFAWMFQTIGIALGSWWAYYELGWGGWWFWDPVENASFMPWLVGTALIHSLSVTEKRGIFKSWTLLLAIFAFSLSLVGTFLVRSGVLVSVHSFATDPKRGLYILAFLVLTIGGSLTLYAWRAPKLYVPGGFELFSREFFLLVNNVILVSVAGLVLWGTLSPLVYELLGIGKISVGPPVFAVMFLVPMLPLMVFLAIGMHSAWRRGKLTAAARPLWWLLGAAMLLAVHGAGTGVRRVPLGRADRLQLSASGSFSPRCSSRAALAPGLRPTAAPARHGIAHSGSGCSRSARAASRATRSRRTWR
jgi:cytochrome c-type biogenesis protein CcmF